MPLSQFHKTHISFSTDESTGKPIVADILPPNRSQSRVVLAGPIKKSDILPKNPSFPLLSKKSMPAITGVVEEKSSGANRKRGLPPSREESPFKKEPGNQRAFDEWFQKERKAHGESPAVSNTVGEKKSYIKRFLMVFIVVLSLLGVGGYGVSYFWGRMDVQAVLKSHGTELHEGISVAISPSSADDIAGEIVQVSDTREALFPASGRDTVRAKAKGIITVYNAFDLNPQTLVPNTRFESPDGNIYRIRESAVIPGAVIENGVLSPRSVEVPAYADQPGIEYNTGLTEFKIPGFKGSPRYDGFYARSKTPMEGGYIGETSVITQQDLDRAREALEGGLKDIILQKLRSAVPKGFELLDAAYEITTDTRTFTAEVGDALQEFRGVLTLQARGLVFRHADVERFLAMKANLKPDEVTLINYDELLWSVERRSIDQGILILRVEGPARFVWNLNTNLLTERLVGVRNPDMINDIFKEFDAIDRAEVRFSPSWTQNIPREASRISITTRY